MSEIQYVVFKLDGGEYGVEIIDVKEIIPYEDSISIPNQPTFIEGIINHRGSVITIINLKDRFSLNKLEVTDDTRIIIVSFEDRDVGFIVDEVSKIVRLGKDEIDPPPSIGGVKDYVTGIGKNEDILVLIDLERTLTEEVKESIRKDQD